MPSSTLSTYMNLPIPTVGQEPGPQYAIDINASLTILDQHDHSSGLGVQVTPSGLNINADLAIGNNNITGPRTVRFTSQSGALALSSDLGCLYMVTNDLYYNDGLGNQIRLTQSGSIVGTTGSISGLVSPATATYVAADSTFVFQSAANTPAHLDGASLLLRNLSLNSKALTLSPPAAMGANYSIVLPTLPVSTKILSMDSSGNMTATYGVDNSTIGVSANNLGVIAGGITATQLASNAVTTVKITDLNVTNAKIGPKNLVSTNFDGLIASGTQTAITLSALVTVGRPVRILFQPSSNTDGAGYFGADAASGFTRFRIVRDGTILVGIAGPVGGDPNIPLNSLEFLDSPSAGSHVYTLQVASGAGAAVSQCTMIAYEV